MTLDRTRASATLHDVAREAGVSLATASRSLNGSARKVNEAYRDRVLAAAAKLDYVPNRSAQATAKGSTTAVSLIVSDIADPYFSSIAAGVIEQAEDAALIVTMSVTERDPVRELELVRALRGQRPQVIILAGSRHADAATAAALTDELEAFQNGGGRAVFVSRHDSSFDTVLVDNHGGARELAGRLADLGYRRFAAITGDRSLLTVQDRIAGFSEGLAERGIRLSPENIVEGAFTRDGGYECAARLLSAGLGDIELIFATNDVMAIGAMSALREAGVRPGEDVAVAGFDDIPTVRDVTPALTTVGIPLTEVGRAAMELALDAGARERRSIPVSTEVLLRASTPRLGARAG